MDKTDAYLVIIVLYKCKLQESVAFKSIYNIKCKNIGYFIYDNSPTIDKDALTYYNIKYIWDNKNGGVSKAYNEGAQYALLNNYNWIILLDQDTEFSGIEYLLNIKYCRSIHPEIKLFAPLVKTEKSIISPYPIKDLDLRKCKIMQLNNLFLINCGICVNLETFLQSGGYDEALYLDFADNLFIENLRENIDDWCLIDTIFKQNFSNNIIEFENLWNRFIIYVDCLKIYKQKTKYNPFLLYIKGLKHALGLSLRTFNLSFIRYFVSNTSIK